MTVPLDILVVGAGMVGTPLAVALAGQGWQVGLCDPAPILTPPVVAPAATGSGRDATLLDQRCTALSAGAAGLLEQWGLWSEVQADACPIHTVHVSQRGHLGATRLRANEMAVPALGHVVNNATFVAGLQSALPASAVQCHPATRVTGLEVLEDRVCIQVEAGDGQAGSLSARLLIAVDGVESVVRKSLGIGITRVDHEQSAVLGMLRLDRPHGHQACERFTANGPLALLPRADNLASFVCCTDSDSAAELAVQDEAQALQNLQQRFGYRLGRFIATGTRQVVPMVRIEARQQRGPRTLLLGSAARLLHPVAGQGYNLALRDVAECVWQLRLLREQCLGLGHPAAHTMVRARNRASSGPDADPGAGPVLNAIVQARGFDQRATVGLTDTLARLFRGHAPAMGHARALGLLGLDLVPPLRQRFARRTMGMA